MGWPWLIVVESWDPATFRPGIALTYVQVEHLSRGALAEVTACFPEERRFIVAARMRIALVREVRGWAGREGRGGGGVYHYITPR